MKKPTLSLALALLVLTPLAGCSDDDEAPKNPGTGGSSGAGGSSGTGGDSEGGTPLTCAEVCAKIDPLDCPKGPPAESVCVAFCNGISAGTDMCAAAMRSLLSCAKPSTTVQCAGDGNPTSADCANEFAAVVPCLPTM